MPDDALGRTVGLYLREVFFIDDPVTTFGGVDDLGQRARSILYKNHTKVAKAHTQRGVISNAYTRAQWMALYAAFRIFTP